MAKRLFWIGSHDPNTSCVERWALVDLERFSLSGFVMRPLKNNLSLTRCAHGWCAVVITGCPSESSELFNSF